MKLDGTVYSVLFAFAQIQVSVRLLNCSPDTDIVQADGDDYPEN